MAPVRPEEMLRSRGGFVSEDRLCIGCGYNLKGLKASANCPECNRPIHKGRGTRGANQIINAPYPWLWSLRTGTLLLLLCGPGLPVLISRASITAPLWVSGLASGLGAGWALGVWLTTQPRPVLPGTVTMPSAEWRRLRVLARCTQLGWAVSSMTLTGIALLDASVASTHPLVRGFGIVLPVCAGVVGLIPLSDYLSKIAHWAEDDDLSTQFRIAEYTLGAGAVLLLVLVVGIGTGFMARGAGVGIGWMLSICLFSAGLYWMICLFKLFWLARWAVINHSIRQGQIDELRAKADKALAAANAERQRSR